LGEQIFLSLGSDGGRNKIFGGFAASSFPFPLPNIS
jgi:hypothetical protein